MSLNDFSFMESTYLYEMSPIIDDIGHGDNPGDLMQYDISVHNSQAGIEMSIETGPFSVMDQIFDTPYDSLKDDKLHDTSTESMVLSGSSDRPRESMNLQKKFDIHDKENSYNGIYTDTYTQFKLGDSKERQSPLGPSGISNSMLLGGYQDGSSKRKKGKEDEKSYIPQEANLSRDMRQSKNLHSMHIHSTSLNPRMSNLDPHINSRADNHTVSTTLDLHSLNTMNNQDS